MSGVTGLTARDDCASDSDAAEQTKLGSGV